MNLPEHLCTLLILDEECLLLFLLVIVVFTQGYHGVFFELRALVSRSLELGQSGEVLHTLIEIASPGVVEYHVA